MPDEEFRRLTFFSGNLDILRVFHEATRARNAEEKYMDLLQEIYRLVSENNRLLKARTPTPGRRPDGGPILYPSRQIPDILEDELRSFIPGLRLQLDHDFPNEPSGQGGYIPGAIGLRRALSIWPRIQHNSVMLAISEDASAMGGRREAFATEFGDINCTQLYAFYTEGTPYSPPPVG
jgi:hypothetical protein